jgi:isopenicillin-N epimerase
VDRDDLARRWALDPGVLFLNHGSFGACPRAVLEVQASLRARMEAEPVRFFTKELGPLLDDGRAALGAFLRAEPEGLAFVRNATAGVNTVLRSLDLAPGDELLATSHGYAACANALGFVAERAGARVVVADVPFPIDGPDAVVEAVLARVGPRTRLALLDHVTSPTGLVFPVERLVAALAARGVDTLVDGAHAPGMLDLDLDALGAAYYTGNGHKWLCAPKGAAFLWVRADRRDRVRPLAISHGALEDGTGRSRFRREMDWTGTDDPSAALSLPAALASMGALLPGGWPALRGALRSRALAARREVAEALGLALPAPDAMLGALASLRLPGAPRAPTGRMDPLHARLQDEDRIQVPVFTFAGARVLRLGMHLYVPDDAASRLVAALRPRLAAGE